MISLFDLLLVGEERGGKGQGIHRSSSRVPTPYGLLLYSQPVDTLALSMIEVFH